MIPEACSEMSSWYQMCLIPKAWVVKNEEQMRNTYKTFYFWFWAIDFPFFLNNQDNYTVIWVRMHAQFPISKPNLLPPVAISIKKKRNIITMSLSSLRVSFCNYNTSLGQMCENGRLIPARIFLFLVRF